MRLPELMRGLGRDRLQDATALVEYRVCTEDRKLKLCRKQEGESGFRRMEKRSCSFLHLMTLMIGIQLSLEKSDTNGTEKSAFRRMRAARFWQRRRRRRESLEHVPQTVEQYTS